MRFCLLDLSNGAQTRDGGSMTPTLLAQTADATMGQLCAHFATEYGGDFDVRAGDNQTDLQDGEYPFALLATLADAPGAIAYHTANGNGMPLLFDGVTLSDTLNGPGNSVSVAISHELLETAYDEGANVWVDSGDGTEHAQEVCDPVEQQTYPVTLTDGTQIWVSNFVLRAWWVQGRSGPYSYGARALQVQDCPGPLLTLPGGGYQIMREYNPTSENSVQGRTMGIEGVMRRRPGEPHQGQRKHRRGLR
jgi:hypothetical protein